MRSGFFNSEIIGYDAENMPVFDRAEEASFFAKYFSQFISNGVFPNPSTNMQVLATEGMTVKVDIGVCYINGYMGWVEPFEILEIEESDTRARIDRIVARLDFTDRNIKLAIKKGTVAGTPVAPTLQRDYDIYEIGLADVKVNANVVEIKQENITDLRLNTELCGVVANHLQHLDTTTLFNQYQDWLNRVTSEAEEGLEEWKNECETILQEEKQKFETSLEEERQKFETILNNLKNFYTEDFNTWFNNLKVVLSGDVAGNLQLEIESLQETINEIQDNINEKTEELTEDYMEKINDLKQIVVAPNAAAHNAIYRGKDITDLFYNGTLSQQIANQTFDDIFIGDYIIGKTSGRKYLVADINYRLNITNNDFETTPHILMIPEKIMGTANMNDTDITTGGYIGSKMHTSNLIPYRNVIKGDFGAEHILVQRNLFTNEVTNGYASNGTWYGSDIELMNENMVYGASIFTNVCNGTNLPYNYTADKSQLSLFRYRHDLTVALNDEGKKCMYWLRDVVSSTSFANVYSTGFANYDDASEVGGIRPAFLIY